MTNSTSVTSPRGAVTRAIKPARSVLETSEVCK